MVITDKLTTPGITMVPSGFIAGISWSPLFCTKLWASVGGSVSSEDNSSTFGIVRPVISLLIKVSGDSVIDVILVSDDVSLKCLSDE